MANSWIPINDEALDPFLNNFQTLIAASPTSYGLVAGDATAITAAYTAWHTAFLAAINPTTRTRATVATKNTQKLNALQVVRRYAATIRANHGISDALKIGLGIHIPDTVPTPVPPPATQPVLTIVSAGIGSQILRAADETTPNKRARPVGTTGLLLFRAVENRRCPRPLRRPVPHLPHPQRVHLHLHHRRQRQDRHLLRPLDQQPRRAGPLERAPGDEDRGVRGQAHRHTGIQVKSRKTQDRGWP